MSKALTEDSLHGGYILKTPTQQFHISTGDALNHLGKGAFGVVYRGTKDSNSYAIKQIDKARTSANMIKLEYDLMAKARINNFYNVASSIDFVEDSTFYYIVMPLYDEGKLSGFISKKGISSETEAIEYFRQICYGLSLLHKAGIIHRDLKADNILLQSYSNPYYPYKHLFFVSDFGLAKQFEANGNTKAIGTCPNMAPEVPSGSYNFKADVYSLGTILFKMLSGVEPFNGQNPNQCKELKEVPSITIKSMFNEPISEFSISLLEDCLQYDQMLRMPNNVLFDVLKLSQLYDRNYKCLDIGKPSASQKLRLSKQGNVAKFIEIQFDCHINESIKIKEKKDRAFKICKVSNLNIVYQKQAEHPLPNPVYFIKDVLEVNNKSNESCEDVFVGCGKDGIVICAEENTKCIEEIPFSQISVAQPRKKNNDFLIKYKKSSKATVSLVFTCGTSENRDTWVKLINMGMVACE
jgi:serine/threonine protein kinase